MLEMMLGSPNSSFSCEDLCTWGASVILGPAHLGVYAGRGGSCELMIGCIAQAKNDTVHMDDTEMEEVRWVSRADVAKALDRSSSKDNPLTGDNAHSRPLKPSAAGHMAIVGLFLPLPFQWR